MKYGYELTGNGLYIPQFDKGSGMEPFRSRHINGDLRVLVEQLAIISAPRKWSSAQWLLDPFNKGIKAEDRVVFFTKPLLLRAFLGAAKYWYETAPPAEVIDP